MLPSQSNTFNLLQLLPVPQDPLLLHPAGIPPFLSCPVEQLPHAIIYIYLPLISQDTPADKVQIIIKLSLKKVL
jgi:hypothetical protein